MKKRDGSLYIDMPPLYFNGQRLVLGHTFNIFSFVGPESDQHERTLTKNGSVTLKGLNALCTCVVEQIFNDILVCGASFLF